MARSSIFLTGTIATTCCCTSPSAASSSVPNEATGKWSSSMVNQNDKELWRFAAMNGDLQHTESPGNCAEALSYAMKFCPLYYQYIFFTFFIINFFGTFVVYKYLSRYNIYILEEAQAQ